jgi:hypothetical protein
MLARMKTPLCLSFLLVAGMNYRLRLKVKVDGKVKEAEAVVWRKLSGEHELTSWTWK